VFVIKNGCVLCEVETEILYRV